jgi:hypothetical protein
MALLAIVALPKELGAGCSVSSHSLCESPGSNNVTVWVLVAVEAGTVFLCHHLVIAFRLLVAWANNNPRVDASQDCQWNKSSRQANSRPHILASSTVSAPPECSLLILGNSLAGFGVSSMLR